MRSVFFCAAALAACLSAPAAVLAAATSQPSPLPTPELPKRAMHVVLEVEVNAKGQVVRVLHGTLSGDPQFDTMMIGNALQAWIRHPDQTAEPGLYKITYDYNPSTHNVKRTPTIIKRDSTWANEPGAATVIVADAKREAKETEQRLQAEQKKREQEQAKNLPDINAAVKAATHPTSSPKPR